MGDYRAALARETVGTGSRDRVMAIVNVALYRQDGLYWPDVAADFGTSRFLCSCLNAA
jgi:hypothetical protein